MKKKKITVIFWACIAFLKQLYFLLKVSELCPLEVRDYWDIDLNVDMWTGSFTP